MPRNSKPTAYRIRNWANLYEPSPREHCGAGKLRYVRWFVWGHVVSPASAALARAAGASTAEVFGLFGKMLELAADEPRGRRDGTLLNDDHEPATAGDMALLWEQMQISEHQVSHALDVLEQAGWIERVKWTPQRAEAAESDGKARDGAQRRAKARGGDGTARSGAPIPIPIPIPNRYRYGDKDRTDTGTASAAARGTGDDTGRRKQVCEPEPAPGPVSRVEEPGPGRDRAQMGEEPKYPRPHNSDPTEEARWVNLTTLRLMDALGLTQEQRLAQRRAIKAAMIKTFGMPERDELVERMTGWAGEIRADPSVDSVMAVWQGRVTKALSDGVCRVAARR